MKNGIYGLISLTGAPLSDADRILFGLSASRNALHALNQDGLALQLQDASNECTDSGLHTQGNRTVAFLGSLDNRSALVESLGADIRSSAAALVLAALDRWGTAAFAQLQGEWSLLLLDKNLQLLQLATSETLRDQMFFSYNGSCVAVAPQATLLARLSWVGSEFDPLGLICSMSRWAYRSLRDGRTPFNGVTAVECGTEHRLGASKHYHSRYSTIPDVVPWTRSYAAAISELNEMTSTIVRRQLRRHASTAILLSGGLDSSLLSLLAARERGPEQKLFAVSSVAPAGGRLTDERKFIDIVAAQLEIPIHYVIPPEFPTAYHPDAQMFSFVEEPIISQRYYLYEALYKAALREGATAVFDGAYGELAITRTVALTTLRSRIARLSRKFRSAIRSQGISRPWPDAGLHVKLSTPARSLLLDAFGSDNRAPANVVEPISASAPLGFAVGYAKSGKTPTDTWHPSLRHLYPYRDRQLVQLVARLPAKFSESLGMSRSLGRALIGTMLPATISMRSSKHAFSPDYHVRLRSQALLARERLSVHSAHGAADWLDLDWTAKELTALHSGAKRSTDACSVIQCTVFAAEFFTWWASERAGRR